MEQRPSAVIIYKRGRSFCADVTGCYGGGFFGAHIGDTPEEAALFALRAKGSHIDTNPLGGTMHLPAEVRKAMEATAVTICHEVIRQARDIYDESVGLGKVEEVE